MQKKVLIAVVVMAAAGLGLLTLTQLSKKSSSPPTSVAQSTTSSDGSTIKGSIKSLMGMNKNVKCTYSDPTEKTASEGTIYASAQKVRADIKSTDEKGNKMDTYMYTDGQYSYIWSSASKDGTKIKISEAEKLSGENKQQSGQSVDMDEEVDMNCSNWSVDNSKFEVPGDIKFTDMSEFLKNLGAPASGSTSTSPAESSSMCDQIPDAQAKAACLSATSDN